MRRISREALILGAISLFLISPAGDRGAALADPRPTNAGFGPRTIELLGYAQSGYRFKVIGRNERPPEGFQRPNFSPIGFGVGTAAFGGGRRSGGAPPCELSRLVRTDWPRNTQLIVRKAVTVPNGAAKLRIMVEVDNDIAGVFFDGVQLGGSVVHEGCPVRDEFRFDVPGAVQPGEKIVAFHLIDRGEESFFDMRVLAEAPDPELVGLEVIQSIQNWNNTVPLIEGKTTFVRAHIQTPDDAPSLPFVIGQLRGFRDGVELPGSPLTPHIGFEVPVIPKPEATGRRGNLRDSFIFRLPEAWLNGSLELRVEDVRTPETSGFTCKEAAGPTPDDCAVTVSFAPSDDMQVKLFLVEWTDQANGTVSRTNSADIVDLIRHTTAIFPIAKLDLRIDLLPLGELTTPPTLDQVMAQLMKVRTQESMSGTEAGNRLYQGVIEKGLVEEIEGVGPLGGVGSINGPFSALHSQASRGTASAHEFAHNLNRGHAPFCRAAGTVDEGFPANLVTTIGGSVVATISPNDAGTNDEIWGLNTADPVLRLLPPRSGEFMSYCPTPWISTYNYAAVRAEIDRLFDRPPPASSATPIAGAAPAIRDILLVRGAIDLRANTARFLPFATIESASVPPLPPPGNFAVRLLDPTGAILTETPFQAPSLTEDADTALFLVPVLFDPAAAEVLLLHRGAVIGSIAATAGKPRVRVIFPNGRESLSSRTVQMQWQASDADRETLTYDVQYSPNAGATWETIATDWPKEVLEIERRFLPATGEGLIRVTASDGFNSANDQSDAVFDVSNNAPEILILAPRANAAFVRGETIPFEALAEDREDGILQSDRLQWSSSIDGFLEVGNRFTRSASDLSAGRHIITVTATDSLGTAALEEVGIRVSLEPAPPVRCNGRRVTIIGTRIGETLTGTTGPDVIHGLGGNDIIVGRDGHDLVCGGPGRDTLRGQGGNDRLFGEEGDDSLQGGAGDDHCNGGAGRDTRTGC